MSQSYEAEVRSSCPAMRALFCKSGQFPATLVLGQFIRYCVHMLKSSDQKKAFRANHIPSVGKRSEIFMSSIHMHTRIIYSAMFFLTKLQMYNN